MILFLNLVCCYKMSKRNRAEKLGFLQGTCHHRSCTHEKNLAGGDRRRSWRKVMELVMLLISGRVKQVHFLLARAGVLVK